MRGDQREPSEIERSIPEVEAAEIDNAVAHSGIYERLYQIAGVNIRVTLPFPFTDTTFRENLRAFEVNSGGSDVVTIRHEISLPTIDDKSLGELVYQRPPWSVYRYKGGWLYMPTFVGGDPVIFFSYDHLDATIYHNGPDRLRRGQLQSLTAMATDQIYLAQVMAERAGAFFHASGVVFEGRGILFVGHSEAGKSTMVGLLKDSAHILCDDRIIVRKWPDGFRIHGTWSHGDVPTVSPDDAPLSAVCFLEKANENRIIPIDEPAERRKRLLSCLVRPLETAQWWERMLDLVSDLACNVPCFRVRFDRSAGITSLLEEL